MIRKLMFFFHLNKELANQNNSLQQVCYSLEGEIRTLKQWNESLKQELTELKTIVYKRSGLIKEQGEINQESKLEVVRKSNNWREVQRELSEQHRKGTPLDATLQAQQEHWKQKLEKERGTILNTEETTQ
jgi:hypothetical protein